MKNSSSRIVILVIVSMVACTQSSKNIKGDTVIHVDVVALDHTIYFNRFGSHDPYGMIYALKSDVRSKGKSLKLDAGNVTLRSGKRPRPLVLRIHKGDILEITFTNLLSPQVPFPADSGAVLTEESAPIAEKDRNLKNNPCAAKSATDKALDSPVTRCAAIALSGLATVDAGNAKNTGIHSIPPNATTTYRWRAERTGTFQFSSLAAPSGGQGDGGSLVHGLFGTVNVEPAGTSWYRSAVRESDMQLAKSQAQSPAIINYEAVYPGGKPVLNLLQRVSDDRYNLIYSPLDAIIVDSKNGKAFREFTVIFHDELKTVYQPAFSILSPEQFTQKTPNGPEKDNKIAYSNQLSGIRDGFAINYGASGMGTILLANRMGIGPAKDCVDCLYEEFFLQSWANGDPALLAEYEDDPSNVHHSYLNDPVVFQNSHAGPKETHVFHLHAHQWLSSDSGHANYLDSQTIAPQQSFSYEIHYQGSGNRNLTPGDSIFHCHLYPHFAQGMWSLWRVHDVFEDGSRRLPDGGDNGLVITGRGASKAIQPGIGTDPMTGVTHGGTPIPAIVPLPYLALPPEPTYGKNGFPGYPFYIAGEAGHRAPQPPIDIIEDGGLGRHIITSGERSFPGGDTPVEQVINADLTVKINQAHLKLIPNEGTPLEQMAMRFHANSAGHASKTPGGKSQIFQVNGNSPQPGAPFADPCGKDKQGRDRVYNTRRYRVSAIDLGIQTNEDQWHDPQSRINVLNTEVDYYENQRFVKDAEPFFFRAESGECVEFVHTNRTSKDLYRDDFQVATPTDIIGQHIHLVKFDVTSSDGSANGFNYQDGTMAWEAIAELTEASHAARGGSVVDYTGKPITEDLHAKGNVEHPVYQQTIQRWWVDPFMHVDGYDAGLGTVFTHDHFAPSSIQQHGFYNALLVEPKGSVWLTPSGKDLKAQDKPCKPVNISGFSEKHYPGKCLESFAVGSRAQIITDRSTSERHPDTREFALAVADFALLYDAQIKNAPPPEYMEHLVDEFRKIRQKEGSPVDPPKRPEAITTDHHNPYLFNYKHEPIPLRIGKRESNKHFQLREDSLCNQPHTNNPVSDTICNPKDIAYAFSSRKPHGDPFLKPLRAYEGDRVQIRLVQGAQEVQHTFNVHGLSWKREQYNPSAPRVNAQEIGISEHFEFDVLNLGNINRGLKVSDYLFHAGSQDALWNGAWGLIRAFADPEARDPTTCESATGIVVPDYNENAACKKVGNPNDWQQSSCSAQDDRLDGCMLKPLPDNADGKITAKTLIDSQGNSFKSSTIINRKYCEGKTRKFQIEAWQVSDLRKQPLFYDQSASVYDPDALVYIEKANVEKYKNGGTIEPLVLRVKADECIKVELISRIEQIKDSPGDALMPKIVSFNVDQVVGDNGRQARPSNRIGLHPQLVDYNVSVYDGSFVGLNPSPTLNSGLALFNDVRPKVYHWYTGRLELKNGSDQEEQYRLIPFDKPLVAALTPADPIGQLTHGLFGALIIYPQEATFEIDKDSHLSARVRYTDRNGKKHNYREHVVFYQDGLNLYQKVDGEGAVIPDCFICDDSYDRGEKAVNYRSVAFWQRLGLKVEPGLNTDDKKGYNLNAIAFPANFYEKSYKALPFKDFTAKPEEEMRFVVVHPGGRARQRTFQLYGHSFTTGIKGYGSSWSMLLAPGKAETLIYSKAHPGVWLYRDGPSYMFASGVWGRLRVE